MRRERASDRPPPDAIPVARLDAGGKVVLLSGRSRLKEASQSDGKGEFMTSGTRQALAAAYVALLMLAAPAAQAGAPDAHEVMRTWYRLMLELVRHTPTYSPPVAARAFGYLGVTAHEVAASGSPDLMTLAGQVNGLAPLADRDPGATYDDAVVMQAAMAATAHDFFSNTGPTGQRALRAMERTLGDKVSAGLPSDVVDRSRALGKALAAHVFDWSQADGGAVVENMGFPLTYSLKDGPSAWVPTSAIRQQQAPLLPNWGRNRPFVLPDGTTCPVPPPPAYSEEPGSAFHTEAMEVYETSKTLTPEQVEIARFWSDDPMLSPTPPGHWISIGWTILDDRDAGLEESADVMARLGMAQADAFIANWEAKYRHDLLRPVTYIRRVIDKSWEPLLITPPFPEYPSGHSTQSGAAASVLTALYGPDVAFADDTHIDDGLPVRTFSNFWEAANEAGISRLYGGIHFRAAIENGLAQGDCVGGHVNALKTRR